MSSHKRLTSFQLSQAQLAAIPVLGIAGNFAEHLNQAGEAADFIAITTESAEAPKGLFPIYLPNQRSFLGVYPLSHEQIVADFSQIDPPTKLQIEPELALLLDVFYDVTGQVTGLAPVAFTAFNDCSNRIHAPKISFKKNWGPASTGIAQHWFKLENWGEQSDLQNYAIACYHQRAGLLQAYGQTTPVKHYSYWNERLMNWMLKQLNTQLDEGPLEDMPAIVHALDYPKQLIVSLGATRYTAFGEQCYLQPGDQLSVWLVPLAFVENLPSLAKETDEKLVSQGVIRLKQLVQDLTI
ncbi:hypothetical protein THIAE_07035 [Thiomicrospira aerophila AL3]|uniref:Uncharacterized protein n=1 Tax=Thiomicrospira aerophila AL3 TaxID=717772 RepID=W0DW84_9GAMM|nr:DUF5718 family protein [Thiomicrospira aerophila]AHF01543.1 hypothetical protein THIAE_07035 [Thiomicrospira aerophila AL3]